MAVFGAATAGYNYYSQKKDLKRRERALNKLSYDKTAQGTYLNKVRSQGSISKAEAGGIVGDVAQTAYGRARKDRLQYMGNAKKQMGISGGSIALARGAGEFGRNASNQVSKTRRGISMENARSKAEAEKQYAAGQQGFDENIKRQREDIEAGREASNRQLFGGLLGSLGAAYSAYAGNKAAKAAKDTIGSGGSGGIPTPGFDADDVPPGIFSGYNSQQLSGYAKERGLDFDEAKRMQMETWKRLFKEGKITY